jgi:hypothetical protein
MWKFVERLVSQEGSVRNARDASTELCRRRVERAEVETFLAEHAPGVTRSA